MSLLGQLVSSLRGTFGGAPAKRTPGKAPVRRERTQGPALYKPETPDKIMVGGALGSTPDRILSRGNPGAIIAPLLSDRALGMAKRASLLRRQLSGK